ncbi:uncharacterized protein LOC143883555 [Tasmannia lanceolata]|uniref:uncharacterized protein LOC143883555 n=1 Tax=Tasmannia lanceolata TaxID=3420 RepID=UPI004062F74F
MDSKSGANPRLFLDFQPSSNWIRGDASDTLLVYLPGFRRDKLKVQLDNLGNLRLSGERPLDGNRWSRFQSNFHISDNCNINEVVAKFVNGTLSITMPKKIPQVTSLPQPTPNQKFPSQEAPKEPKSENIPSDIQKKATPTAIPGEVKDQSNGSIEARKVPMNGMVKDKQEKTSEFVDAKKKMSQTTERVNGDEFLDARNTAEWAEKDGTPDSCRIEDDKDHGKCGPRRLIVNVLIVAIVVGVALGTYVTITLRPE